MVKTNKACVKILLHIGHQMYPKDITGMHW